MARFKAAVFDWAGTTIDFGSFAPVGVALSGNAVGRTPEELAAMHPDKVARLRADASATLKDAGADHVIDTVADLPALLDRLEVA
jgi:phosphonoacetaldehyde hydrolase